MSALDHIVPLLPCYNSRPLEEYFSLAQQLRLKGKQLAVAGEELEAYIALRQFRDLGCSMQQHNGYHLPQYRGLKYGLGQELAACDKQLAVLSARILGMQRLEPSRRKTIALPADLIPTFVHAVRANTARNTETVGILGGRPHGDLYEIQGLVIPAQRGASDTCECTDDPTLSTSKPYSKAASSTSCKATTSKLPCCSSVCCTSSNSASTTNSPSSVQTYAWSSRIPCTIAYSVKVYSCMWTS